MYPNCIPGQDPRIRKGTYQLTSNDNESTKIKPRHSKLQTSKIYSKKNVEHLIKTLVLTLC